MKTDKMDTSIYKGIPAMSPPEVHAYLNEIGRGWTGHGVALEAGCWLGATSRALMDGLVEAGYDKPFWAFDRWRANGAEVQKAKLRGVQLHEGEDLKPIYAKNVSQTYTNLKMVQGRIPQKFSAYSGDPIEICLFDAPKRNPVFLDSIRFCEPHFIPGVTVLGLMDYYTYRKHRDAHNTDWEKFLAPVEFIETYADHFTLLREFPDKGSCVFFKYEKPISWKQR